MQYFIIVNFIQYILSLHYVLFILCICAICQCIHLANQIVALIVITSSSLMWGDTMQWLISSSLLSITSLSSVLRRSLPVHHARRGRIPMGWVRWRIANWARITSQSRIHWVTIVRVWYKMTYIFWSEVNITS